MEDIGDEDDDYDFDDSSSGELGEKDNNHFPTAVEYKKFSKPRVSYTRPWATKSNSRSNSKDVETKYCHVSQQFGTSENAAASSSPVVSTKNTRQRLPTTLNDLEFRHKCVKPHQFCTIFPCY